MRLGLLFGGLLILTVAVFSGQQPAPGSAQKQNALVNQYCVTCHNDKLKTANFSLQNLDLATGGGSCGAVGKSGP